MEPILVDIKQRDILLIPFPFSDLSGGKVRPVLVLSNNQFNKSSDDVLVCGITSNIIRHITEPWHAVPLANNDMEEGKIFTESVIRVENILKIDKKLLIKQIGRLKKETFSCVLEKLTNLFTLS